jgi:hypothetical protein
VLTVQFLKNKLRTGRGVRRWLVLNFQTQVVLKIKELMNRFGNWTVNDGILQFYHGFVSNIFRSNYFVTSNSNFAAQ